MDGAEPETLETAQTRQQLLDALGRHYGVRAHLAGTPRPALPGSRPTVTFELLDLPPEQIQPWAGVASQAKLPDGWPDDQESCSTVLLLEDGVPLPRPHAAHDALQADGQGRYSHWNHWLLFASSDGSDPATNGRHYTAARGDLLRVDDLAGRLQPSEGLSWIVDGLPAEWTSDAEGLSPLLVVEDGQRLGPGHMPHDEVREIGAGRYSHTGRTLWFSTSDGSDPRRNGRL